MRTRSALAAAALLSLTLGAQPPAADAAPAGSPSAHATSAAARAKAATKTTVSYKDGYLSGRVTSAGKGVKGLKVRIQRKAGTKWSTYATVTTQKGGGYSAPLVRTGSYRAVTLGTASYKGSTSRPVHT